MLFRYLNQRHHDFFIFQEIIKVGIWAPSIDAPIPTDLENHTIQEVYLGLLSVRAGVLPELFEGKIMLH